MAVQKPVLGPVIKMDDVSQAIKILDDTKIAIVGQYTDEPMMPTKIEGVQKLADAFDKLAPTKEVTLQDAQGQEVKQTLAFKQLEDFTVKGLLRQSALLSDLNGQKEDYQVLLQRLTTNTVFQKALTDPAARQALMEVMRAMLQDLAKADAD
jgi:hypothetical protein